MTLACAFHVGVPLSIFLAFAIISSLRAETNRRAHQTQPRSNESRIATDYRKIATTESGGGGRTIRSRSGVFLVFEYAQHDMATLVDDHHARHGRSPFGPPDVKRLMSQLLDALRFLHSRHVLHRDLKLSNLLYDHGGRLRVADFGLARRVDGGCFAASGGGGSRSSRGGEDDDAAGRRSGEGDDLPSSCLTPKVVSLWYRPPELLLGAERYDQGVDTWGAGCVMGELLRGRPLMDGRTEMDQLSKMVSAGLLISTLI